MIAFQRRRMFGVLSVIGFATVLLILNQWLTAKLVNTAIVTGFLLIFAVAFLVLFNIRKRFSFLPIGRASTWLQIHVYVGYSTILLFMVHTGFRAPTGTMEVILGSIFVVVALSGIVGLFISRAIPSRLTEHGGSIPYDVITERRRQAKQSAEELAIKSIEITKKSTVADFYVDRLEIFFLGSKTFFVNHMLGSKRHLNPLLTRIKAVRRYLNEEENQIMDEIEGYLIEKDNLDYQYTWQTILKTWLFVHIPLSYSLLVIGVFHGLLAFRFTGS